jgi:hypothetical protein
MQRIIGTIIAITLGSALMLDAQEVLLRLSPDLNAPVIERTDGADPVTKAARTITNAGLAQQGWMRSDKSVQLEGYLRADKISKNFEIEINAKVYPTSNLQGATVTRIEAGDPIELLDVQDAWSRIRIEKVMPVYFKLEPTRAPLPIYVPPFQEAARAARATRVESGGRVGTLRPEQLPPENVVWSGTSNTTPAAPRAAAPSSTSTLSQIQMAPTPTAPSIEADGRIYRLSGQLVRAITSEAPQYSLRLENSVGANIAYVDASQMYIEDMRDFTDQNVHIHGEVRPIEPGGDLLVIIARTIRIGE